MWKYGPGGSQQWGGCVLPPVYELDKLSLAEVPGVTSLHSEPGYPYSRAECCPQQALFPELGILLRNEKRPLSCGL